jgi:hypothetical protein
MKDRFDIAFNSGRHGSGSTIDEQANLTVGSMRLQTGPPPCLPTGVILAIQQACKEAAVRQRTIAGLPITKINMKLIAKLT